MTVEDFLKLEADDILRLPYIHKYGKDKTAEIKVLTIGKLIEINPFLTQIAKEDLKAIREAAEKNYFEEMPELFDKYALPIANIIRAMTEAEVEEMEFRDVYIILLSILARMGTNSFQKSIITGSVLSRNQEPEIIAAQEYLTQSDY